MPHFEGLRKTLPVKAGVAGFWDYFLKPVPLPLRWIVFCLIRGGMNDAVARRRGCRCHSERGRALVVRVQDDRRGIRS